jgi:hypothetical protein
MIMAKSGQCGLRPEINQTISKRAAISQDEHRRTFGTDPRSTRHVRTAGESIATWQNVLGIYVRGGSAFALPYNRSLKQGWVCLASGAAAGGCGVAQTLPRCQLVGYSPHLGNVAANLNGPALQRLNQSRLRYLDTSRLVTCYDIMETGHCLYHGPLEY